MRRPVVVRSGRRGVVAVVVGLVFAGLLAVVVSGPATAANPASVTGISPDAGLTTGDTLVTVSGAGFTGATAVDFGTQAGTLIDVISDTSLTVTSPAESAGTVDVTVMAPGGTSTTSAADQFTYVAPGPAPVVSEISPNSGLDLGGTLVTFTGTGFTGTTAVDFADQPGTSIDVISDTTLTVVSPPGFGGREPVSVVTPNGTAESSFTFVAPGPPPTVTGVSPPSGLSTGTTVTVTGTGLTGASAVDFGAVPATSYIVSSDSTLLVESPAGEPPGTVDVTVVTPNGTSATSPADQFQAVAPGPPPTISAVTPNAGTTAGGVTFSIVGAGFTGASVVDIGTVAVPFTVNSDTSVTATSAVQPAGTYDVTVTTPNGTNTPALPDEFTVVAPLPVVTSVSPPSGTTDGATAVTISGTGFTFATAVDFGSTPAASYVVNSDTTITAVSPAAAAGAVDVTVTTAGGTSVTSPADQYTFITPPLVVSALSPDLGSTQGGTLVTITGSDFTSATVVDFGTVSVPFTFISDTEITATSPAASTPGNVDVTVTTSTGTTTPASRHANRFTFVMPPQVNSLSPSSGSAVGGTSVTIRGKRFTGVTAVDFGATPATTFTDNSGGSITATAPRALPGVVNVTVTTPVGTSIVSTGDEFTDTTPPPVLTGLCAVCTPGAMTSSGSTLGGTSVTLTGTGFTGAYAVHFGSAPAASILVESDTTIIATSPPGTVGTVNVNVTTPNGTSAKTPADHFTYFMRITVPVITAVSPHAGPTAGGKTASGQPITGEDAVTITGSGFTGATAVDFGTATPVSPTPAFSFTVVSDTTIDAVSPPEPAKLAATGDVTVTTPDGVSATSADDLFTYVAPGPVAAVTGVSPTSGPDTGGTNVVITGNGLSGATAVDFGTVSVPFTFDEDAGELIAVSPPEAVATVDVTVTTPNGVSVANIRDKFSFTKPQIPPTVTKVLPRKGPTSGGTRVGIHGTGFIGSVGVEFGEVPVNFVVNSDTSITATSPPGSAGSVDITVTSANGTTLTGPSDQFTYKAPRSGPSRISGGSPAAGRAQASPRVPAARPRVPASRQSRHGRWGAAPGRTSGAVAVRFGPPR